MITKFLRSTSYLLSLSFIFCSAAFAAPQFSSLDIASDNANTTLAKVGDVLTFTLNLAPDDDANGVGEITFDIGGTAGLSTSTFLAGGSSATHTVDYTVLAGQNGVASVTGISFQNVATEDLQNLPAFPYAPAPNVTADTTDPVFSSIDVSSDNADTTLAIEGDTITFTLNLTAGDTWSATNRINFDIGPNSFQTAFFASDAVNDASKDIAFVVPAGEDGVISVTGVTFTDFSGNVLGGFIGPYAPAPNVDVDSILPTLLEVVAVANPTNDNTPSYVFSSSEVGTIAYAGDCSSATAVSTALPANTPIDFNALADGLHSNCTIRVTDDHTNQSVILNVSNFLVDTLAPSIDTASVLTSGNGDFAKAGDTVTYTINFSENVTVTAINTASSAANITTLSTELDVVGGSIDILEFTAQAGDDGVVTPSVDFDIQDSAGNTATINSLGVIVGGPAVTDTTAPELNPVVIASNNVNTVYAKTNDTVTLSFTSSEAIANQSGTLFGEASVVANVGGNNWTSALLTDGNETEGAATFTIDFEDLAGNAGIQVIATTDASSVTFDKTNPTLAPGSVTIISDNSYITDAPTYYAKVGDVITLTFETIEAVQTPIGTLLGKAPVFVNTGGNVWTATVTGGAADPEGNAVIDIHILDLAGNNTLNIIGTMDGTSVLYDRTAPTLPAVVTDIEGVQTNKFKHFSKGQTFNWAGAVDVGSGLYQYIARLENSSVGINETQTILSPVVVFDSASIVPSENPYNFYMNVRDKAGNETGSNNVYQQHYGIKIQGVVREKESGLPIEGASVLVISPYTGVCNIGTEICFVSTNSSGQYEIIVRPNQDYKVDFTATINRYLQKIDVQVGTQDVLENSQLAFVGALQSQQSNQVVAIITNKTFSNSNQSTELLVSSLSGEAEASNTSEGILITSFGRIASVTSNNPEVVIVNKGNNNYLAKNAGSIKLKVDAFTKLKAAKSNFSSGDARLGVVFISGNGSAGLTFPGMTRKERKAILGRQMSYKESLELAQDQNQGNTGAIKYYVNRNGYKVFAGYSTGKLGIASFGKFRKNQVAFRGSSRNHWRYKGDEAAYVAVKNIAGSDGGFKTSAPKRAGKGLKVGTKIDHNDIKSLIRSIKRQRLYKKNKVNKFTRTNNRTYAKSRLKPIWAGKIVRDRRTGQLVSVASKLDYLKSSQKIARSE